MTSLFENRPAISDPQDSHWIRVDTQTGAYFLGGRAGMIGPVRAALRYELEGHDHFLDLVLGAAVVEGTNGQRTEIHAQDENVRARLLLCGAPDVSHVSAKIEARAATVQLHSLTLFRVGFQDTPLADVGRENCRFWGNWHDIWFPVGTAPLEGPSNWDELKNTRAYHWGGLYSATDALVLGYQMPNQWLDGVEWTLDGELVAHNTIGAAVLPGQPFQSDLLRVAMGASLAETWPLLHQNHVSRRRVEEAGDFWGWNSWEAYATRVKPGDVLENVHEIAALPWLREKIRFIIVDDGWQRGLGDWFPNDKFSAGMDALATQIQAQGFEAGIWTAPLLAGKNSEILIRNPGWFIQDGEKPLTRNGETFHLDPTHPAVRDYLFALYRRLYDWGYRYFKTDFLVETPMFFVPGRPEFRATARCHDPNLGIMRGMRAAMQTIRAAIGEDSFWLGCGTDIGSAAGLVDASRTGGDIAPFWTRVPNQARSVIHHSHLHGNLFLADPDFALIKSCDTFKPEFLDIPLESPEPYVVDAWSGGRCFDAQDARTWASLVILSGGIVNLSDRIRGLNDVGLSIVQTVFEYAGGRASVPLDLETPIPRLLLREESEYFLMGVFNWDNEESIEIEVNQTDFPVADRIWDIWSGENAPLDNGALRVQLAPHQSRLFRWEKTSA